MKFITFCSSLTSERALIMHPIVLITFALKFYPSSSVMGVDSNKLERPRVSSSKNGRNEVSITEAIRDISPRISSCILMNLVLVAPSRASTSALSRV